MKAADFGEEMLALGLGNQAMADALGINVKRVRAYATGMRPIPQLVALAAWALMMQPCVASARKLLAG